MNQSNFCYQNAFSFQSHGYRMGVATGYSLTSISAVSLNTLVFFTIWKTSTLHKPSYILLANLALTDLLVGAIVQPMTVMINIAALKNWNKLFCLLSATSRVVGYWLGSVSLFTLTLISVDRLLAINLKNRYRTTVSLERVIRTLVFWWLKALVVTVLNIFMNSNGESSNLLFIVPAVIICSLLAVITVCYALSFHTLRKLSKPVVKVTTGERVAAKNADPKLPTIPENYTFDVCKYRRSLKTMLLVFISILIFYLPYLCVVIAMAFRFTEKWMEDDAGLFHVKLLVLSELLVILISTTNPVIYLWRVKDFRKASIKKLKEFLKLESNEIIELDS
ncbi:adenosine receptor A3-like [Actinia tenebrosa]|uniref:Adenosine receptor A3-like n=1 Tax=Actinia tenebrosa TaxID=6105 RepID=A0A6P8IH28_ACTTE|nr:adenosine receptor A3-like [Actinia tenebrosa]